MHGEALSAAVDAWLDEIRDYCDLDVEGREEAHGGIMLRLQLDDNPLEEHAGNSQLSVIPPRDGRSRVLFIAEGRHADLDLHFAYYDVQKSHGPDVDIPDQHRMLVWFGSQASREAAEAIRTAYEAGVTDGIHDHLISVEQLMKALRPTTPLGTLVTDKLTRINRRMA